MKEIDSDDMIYRFFGFCWRLKDDIFVFMVFIEEKFFICCGLFLIVNSLFDLLGFILLIIISGKIFFWECIFEGVDWDELLFVNNF